MIRELRVVAEATLLLKGLSSWTKLLRVGENRRANIVSQISCFVNNTQQNLAKCWTVFHGFAYNSLLSRPFLTRNVSNRSSHHTLHNGQGAFSPIQPLVQSTVQSNLGQTWSTSVKLGQLWSKLSKLQEMHPGSCFEGFWVQWTPFRSKTAPVKLRSNLANIDQTWSTLVKLGQISGNVSWTPF